MTNSKHQPIVKKVGGKRVLKRGKASRAEVRQLVSSARASDGKAHKQLVEAYSYLPLHFATTNGVSTERFSEAIKVGMEALQLAIDQYQLDDPEHFTVYVRRWINRRIQRYLRLASLPAKIKNEFKQKLPSKYEQQMDFRTGALRALGKQVKLRLNAQEYAIIEYRYGLNGKSRKTLDEIAELLGVSRQRVNYVECRAIRKLFHEDA